MRALEAVEQASGDLTYIRTLLPANVLLELNWETRYKIGP
jgi:hypothetical protein